MVFTVSHSAAGRRDGETVRHGDNFKMFLRSYDNVSGVCRVVTAGLLWAVGDSEV